MSCQNDSPSNPPDLSGVKKNAGIGVGTHSHAGAGVPLFYTSNEAIENSQVCSDEAGSAKDEIEPQSHRINIVGNLSQKNAYLQCYFWLADQVTEDPSKRLGAVHGCARIMGCRVPVANALVCEEKAEELDVAFNLSDEETRDEGGSFVVSRPTYMYHQDGAESTHEYNEAKISEVCDAFHTYE